MSSLCVRSPFTPYTGCCDENKWQRVTVKKTYLDGATAKVDYVLNTRSGNLFFFEDDSNIKTIDNCLALVYPLYGTAMKAWHVLRIPYDICAIAYNAFAELKGDIADKGGLKAAAYLAKRIFFDIPVSILENVFNAVKDVFFILAVTLGVIFTQFCAKEGRELLSAINLMWMHGKTYEEDFRNEEGYRNYCRVKFNLQYLNNFSEIKGTADLLESYNGMKFLSFLESKGIDLDKKENIDKIPTLITELQAERSKQNTFKVYWNAARKANAFYLAWCFQSRGNIEDTDHIKIVDLKDNLRTILEKNHLKFAEA